VTDQRLYQFRYIPGPIETTRAAWGEYVTATPDIGAAADFVPALGGCFIVLQGTEHSALLRLEGHSLVDRFWGWMQEQRPLIPTGQSIMVVDDDQSILKLLKIVLETAGFEVSGFGNARSALMHLAESEACPDLFLVDLKMPGMDGRTFVSELRKREIQSKVVIISAFDGSTIAADLGAEAMLTKPFEPEALTDLVRSLAASG
jgi:CheY-like chemotaxis protein